MGTNSNSGVVKFFSEGKGFGFIVDDVDMDGNGHPKEYFFHFSNTLDKVEKNDNVTYDLVEGKKGLNAVGVRRIKAKEKK
jgi:CspA family cold shock protein